MTSLLAQSEARLTPAEAQAVREWLRAGNKVKRLRTGEHSLTQENWCVIKPEKRRSLEDKQAAARMRAEGATLDEIASSFRVATGTIQCWINFAATDEQRRRIALRVRRENSERCRKRGAA